MTKLFRRVDLRKECELSHVGDIKGLVRLWGLIQPIGCRQREHVVVKEDGKARRGIQTNENSWPIYHRQYPDRYVDRHHQGIKGHCVGSRPIYRSSIDRVLAGTRSILDRYSTESRPISRSRPPIRYRNCTSTWSHVIAVNTPLRLAVCLFIFTAYLYDMANSETSSAVRVWSHFFWLDRESGTVNDIKTTVRVYV